MRPPLRNLGGHDAFALYQEWFRSLYCDRDTALLDVLGRVVLFDTEPLRDDCAHVCYGGLPGQPYNPVQWDEKRAERIAWIERALIEPNKIHPDRDYPDRHKYLLYLPPDSPQDEGEFYCVIVR